jgi:hypothetical protein
MFNSAVSQPQFSLPSQRTETGPVSRAGPGRISSTSGPLRELTIVLRTESAPLTWITSTRSRPGSQRPS